VARPALTPMRHRVRILLTVLPLLAIFLFGVALLHRRAWRLDLTPGAVHTLSERSRRILAAAPPGIVVRAFLRVQDPRNMMLRDLLRQLEIAAPGLRTEVMDVNRVPGLALEYGVRGVAFVLELGGRRQVVSDPTEDSVIAGLLDLTRARAVRIGWVVGHGEGDPESAERRAGYAQLRRALELDHREVRTVSLGAAGLENDLDVVLIVAPRGDYLPEELTVLGGYLDRGGAMLVMLDSGRAPRLAAFLGRYGVRLVDDLVVDPESRLYGGEEQTIRLTLDQRSHPIVRSLAAPPLFSHARSVAFDPSVGDVDGLEFLYASRSSFATPRRDLQPGAQARFDPARDRPGPIPVGVEVLPRRVGRAGGHGPRLIVLGSGEFASNFFLGFLGNKDIVLNAVAWLARDDVTVGHRTSQQRPGINQFFVSEAEGDRIFWIVVVLVPGMLGLVGVALTVRRRWR
jgi:hypothetical protein